MTSVRRASLKLLTVVSLGLAALVSAWWVRSYWRFDSLHLITKQLACYELVSERGHIEWAYSPRVTYWGSGFRYEHGPLWPERTSRTFLGFGWHGKGWNEPPEFTFDFTPLIMPHAFFAVLFAILPAIHVRRGLRLRRLAMVGRCKKCGYDLRATPARCPECGAENVLLGSALAEGIIEVEAGPFADDSIRQRAPKV